MSVQVLPATAERWADVIAVMGERGDPSHCWCQFFRLRGNDWDRPSEAKRRALRQQVKVEPPPGVLAYDDGTPAGWCAVARRTSYPRVLASKNWHHHPAEPAPGLWTVTCFVVPVGHRRQGMASHLLEGAVELARARGATAVEGNAIDLHASGRTASADLYRSPLSVFLDAGFHEVRRTSPRGSSSDGRSRPSTRV
ncbi:GNAT family N-acetyltransferase [Kribbella deserti]|uniref:GNAT family N-acetyltransferase n=1 Tax=Kribbella deserti TaxID=1926257 RepID=A0ABV6QW55_9ACTN